MRLDVQGRGMLAWGSRCQSHTGCNIQNSVLRMLNEDSGSGHEHSTTDIRTRKLTILRRVPGLLLELSTSNVNTVDMSRSPSWSCQRSVWIQSTCEGLFFGTHTRISAHTCVHMHAQVSHCRHCHQQQVAPGQLSRSSVFVCSVAHKALSFRTHCGPLDNSVAQGGSDSTATH